MGSVSGVRRLKVRNKKEVVKRSAKIAKGRIEEATGALVDNDKPLAKGQTNQAMGHVANKANDVADQAINRPRGDCRVFQSNM